MFSRDKTKELLEQMLAELYSDQARESQINNGSYLIAQDGKLLGKITDNKYDADSILNEYGPYGSPYSGTSIFNQYSNYGSEYGQNSINNPYCSKPPKLIINGQFIGYVTANHLITNSISPEAFLYTLKNDLHSLMSGHIISSEEEVRQLKKESFIQAEDNVFLGKLTPNSFDSESIFNKFGQYGNQFSPISIFNKFSNYGNQFSQLSPFNKFSNTPPKVYLNGNFVAYLTANPMMKPRIDPDDIFQWAEEHVSKF